MRLLDTSMDEFEFSHFIIRLKIYVLISLPFLILCNFNNIPNVFTKNIHTLAFRNKSGEQSLFINRIIVHF